MKCSLCDISIRCSFSPSKGEGTRNSAVVIVPSITPSQHSKGLITGRNVKLLKDMLYKSGFDYYITSLVKCPTGMPTDFEVSNCKKHLVKELFDVKPKLIITIGDLVTSQFLDYKYFKKVVNKASVVTLNNITTIIYPLYSEKNKDVDINTYYKNAFIDLEKVYKAFVDSNYFSLRML